MSSYHSALQMSVGLAYGERSGHVSWCSAVIKNWPAGRRLSLALHDAAVTEVRLCTWRVRPHFPLICCSSVYSKVLRYFLRPRGPCHVSVCTWEGRECAMGTTEPDMPSEAVSTWLRL